MSSARRLPRGPEVRGAAFPKAECCGGAALCRSRRYALGFTLGTVVLALAWYLLVLPVRSARLVVAAPLVMDMRMLPVPQASAAPSVPLLPEVENKLLLSEDAAVAVALPPKLERAKIKQAKSERATPEQFRQPQPQPLRPKVRPDTRPKPVKPQPVRQQDMPPSNTADSAVSAAPSASASAASSTTASTAAQDKNKALAVLLQAIESHKNYPKQARRTGAQGTVLLLVRVGHDGRVTACAVEQTSGQMLLDSATRQLGAKLVGLDTGVGGGAFSVVVPVRYALR